MSDISFLTTPGRPERRPEPEALRRIELPDDRKPWSVSRGDFVGLLFTIAVVSGIFGYAAGMAHLLGPRVPACVASE